MYPYQNHQLAHSVQQLDQPADLAHLLPHLQHLQPDSRASQSSSFNSLATALIPTAPLSHSLPQQQQEARLTHQQPQPQQQVLDHGHHANQFMSQPFRHTGQSGHQHAHRAQQGTRNVNELEMPPLDGWSVSGPGPEPGFDQQFQHDAHGHGQSITVTGMVYHNPKPTYPMHAHAQIMHDAASASDIDAHTAYAQSLASSSSSLSDSLFDYSQGRGEPRAVSASVSDSSGSTGLGMDASTIAIAEERWPDPHGLLPLSVDVGSALETGMVNGGEEIQFGTSYNTGMGVGMDGMNGMGGLGDFDLSMAYNMGYLDSGYSVDSTFGMSIASGHANQGLQSQMQMDYGTGAEYGARNYEGSTSAGQDGWVPVQPEDAIHLQQLQRPLSASSSVGSGSVPGSSSSIAHANTYVPSSTLTSGPPQGQGQEHGAESDNNSTYHSHGVQGIPLQQQQQQHEVAMQISSNPKSSLVQAPQQQVAPAGFSSQQLQQQSQVSQSRVQSQPHPQLIDQQQQPQPRPRETPKLLPGQSGMLPPPDIPVRRKIGRPPMAGGRGGKSAKSAKSAKGGHVRGSGSSEGSTNTSDPVVQSSVMNFNQGYVFPQVPPPSTFSHQQPRTQSLPDLHQPLAHLRDQQVEMQGYSRSPLAHRYSDEELRRGYEKAQAEKEYHAKLQAEAEARQLQHHQQGQVQQGQTMAVTTQTNAQTSESIAEISPSPSSTHLEQSTNGCEATSSVKPASEAATNAKQEVSFAKATTMMADGQWAIAQECNRAAITETFRLRHGRDPPASMNILKTTALERSIPVEKALMKAVQRDMKEIEELNRKAREAARRSWCGENADNLSEGGEEGGQNLEEPPSVDPEFWTKPLDESEWTPAQPGLWAQPSTAAPSWSGPSIEEVGEQQQQRQLVSPISSNTPDEAVTPSDAPFPRNAAHASSSQIPLVSVPSSTAVPSLIDEPTASTSNLESNRENVPFDTTLSSTEDKTLPTEDGPLASRLRPIIRHDGHLPHHVSGLGGAFSEAYDGRSYLPDDAEPNPDNVPWYKPPGARMGDNPLLQDIRPHPLKVRGEKWHALVDPNPDERFKTQVIKEEEMDDEANAKVVSGTETCQDGEHLQHLSMPVDRPGSSTENRPELQPLTKKDLESLEEPSEQGDGYGFPEGGSLGPGLGLRLPGLGDDAEGGTTGKRLKLSTEKKAPPKMACHFCRNRKIACGVGTGEDKTCNQCIRRGLRCVFPTESRRGMRVRKPRSAHTVDGVDEATKDGADEYEEDPMSPIAGPSYSKAKRGRKPKRGRGRPRLSRDQNTGDDEQEVDGAMDVEDPIARMNEDNHDPNNPLASLAAEARRQELQWVHQQPSDMDLNIINQAYDYATYNGGSLPPSAASSSALLSLPGPIDAQATILNGPFTTSPLHRRPGRPKKVARI